MRGVVKFLLSLAAGIAILWLGFWWYAEHRLQAGFQAWADRQAEGGWKVSYASMQRATSPMRAAITVNQLLLTPPRGSGEAISISLPTLGLRIAALDPLVFHTDLPSQIAVTVGDTIGLVLQTGSIAFSENLNPDTLFNTKAYPFRGGDFTASDIEILASGLEVFHIDRIVSHTDFDPGIGAGGTAISSATQMDGLALSPLLTRIAAVPFDGKIAHLSVSARLSGPVPPGVYDLPNALNAVPYNRAAEQKLLAPLLHQWASQGGNGNAGLQLNIGPSTINAAAGLRFDASQQPAGTIDINASRIGRLTTGLVNAYPPLQGDVAALEARLAPYITSSGQTGLTLNMNVVYGAGSVSINGQSLGAMPPLNWTALENPTNVPPRQSGGAIDPGLQTQ